MSLTPRLLPLYKHAQNSISFLLASLHPIGFRVRAKNRKVQEPAGLPSFHPGAKPVSVCSRMHNHFLFSRFADFRSEVKDAMRR